MAKNTQPVLKRCKALGLSPAVLGYSKETKRNPKPQMRRKQSEYGKQIMLQFLERRLDNVVFRMGFASTRREARQLVNHGHFTVNGKRCNIPSALVKPGDVVAVAQKSQASEKFKALLEEYGKKAVPQWIEKNNDSFEGKIAAMPAREDIDYEVSENLIVELYSR